LANENAGDAAAPVDAAGFANENAGGTVVDDAGDDAADDAAGLANENAGEPAAAAPVDTAAFGANENVGGTVVDDAGDDAADDAAGLANENAGDPPAAAPVDTAAFGANENAGDAAAGLLANENAGAAATDDAGNDDDVAAFVNENAAAAGGELVCASSSFRSSAAVASTNESPAIPNVRSMVGTAPPSGMLASPRSTGTTLSNHFDSSSSACTHPEAAAASFSDRLLRPQAMGIDNSAVRRVCR
jgi:hypothetical protein